jgi:amphi-Trp domain-containing protein
MGKNTFHHSFVTDPEDVARYLEALIESFREGRLTFSSNSRKVILEPGKVMDMTVDTSSRRGQTRLTLAFNWPETPAGPQSQGLFPADRD